jgi:hypothetical protein
MFVTASELTRLTASATMRGARSFFELIVYAGALKDFDR